jgi:hypothetical protein
MKIKTIIGKILVGWIMFSFIYVFYFVIDFKFEKLFTSTLGVWCFLTALITGMSLVICLPGVAGGDDCGAGL